MRDTSIRTASSRDRRTVPTPSATPWPRSTLGAAVRSRNGAPARSRTCTSRLTEKLTRAGDDSTASPAIDPRQVAEIYRSLRKGLEDRKNEPGAADFYYGEMEMRRHASPESGGGASRRISFAAEHFVLHVYWLVAGYGVRGSRAVTALAITVVTFAALLDEYGFCDEQSFETSLLFSTQSAFGLLRPPAMDLTLRGEYMHSFSALSGRSWSGLHYCRSVAASSGNRSLTLLRHRLPYVADHANGHGRSRPLSNINRGTGVKHHLSESIGVAGVVSSDRQWRLLGRR
jgi:hypothetical protein